MRLWNRKGDGRDDREKERERKHRKKIGSKLMETQWTYTKKVKDGQEVDR